MCCQRAPARLQRAPSAHRRVRFGGLEFCLLPIVSKELVPQSSEKKRDFEARAEQAVWRSTNAANDWLAIANGDATGSSAVRARHPQIPLDRISFVLKIYLPGRLFSDGPAGSQALPGY